VFGFHRGMDTLGAIAGPALAYFLVKALPYHSIFLIALIPSLIAFALIFILVRDIKTPPDRSRQFIGSIRQLPSEFRFFLIAVGVFGLEFPQESALMVIGKQASMVVLFSERAAYPYDHFQITVIVNISNGWTGFNGGSRNGVC